MARTNAKAYIKGGPASPDIRGVVYFDDVYGGSMVTAHITGLPGFSRNGVPIGPHGFHLHITGDCSEGSMNEPFPETGGHYNPEMRPHGDHAGDFPVLFSNSGEARMKFFTDRFKPGDIVGRSVVIHLSPDDYRTEPAGDSGIKAACGVVVKA